VKGSLASRTAVLVCQGRAAAHGRLAIGHFADPIAARLLRGDELIPVEQVRRGEPPSAASERLRYEWVRACAEVVVPRTVAIDQAVTAAGAPQFVVVGAGLDDRAWRLPVLARSTAYLVDHPASLADAEARSAGLEPIAARLVRVAADLAQVDLAAALAPVGHDLQTPTTWVWEGVVPYLTREQVRTTVAAISRRSAPGSTLIVSYQAPSLAGTLGRPIGRLIARLAGAEDPLRDEPWRSTWTARRMGDLLRSQGFMPGQDEGLLQVGQRLGSPTRGRRSLASGRVVIAVRQRGRGS
jgi:methyltransferase (TIGR00027 family)